MAASSSSPKPSKGTLQQEQAFALPIFPASSLPPPQETEAGLVETFSRCCLHLSQLIWLSLKSDASRWRTERDRKKFQEALGQLILWESVASNLDDTLDPKEDLRTTILELLLGLGKLLDKGQHLITKALDRSLESETLATSIERAEFLVNGGTSSGDESSSFSENSGSEGDGSQARATLPAPSVRPKSAWIDTFLTYATCLMDLAPSAEDPVHEATVEEEAAVPAETDTGISTSEAAQAFATKILDIFPSADLDMVKKLATLNLKRSLSIIEAQNGEALTGGASAAAEKAAPEKAPASVAPSSSFHDSGIGTTAMTMSRYAPSIASVVSDMSAAALRVPPTPKPLTGDIGGFICTLCGQRINRAYSRAEWKRHVHFDLGTYTCLKHAAEQEPHIFSSRAGLAAHEFRQHRQLGRCSVCGKQVSTEAEWASHAKLHEQMRDAGDEKHLKQDRSELEAPPMPAIAPVLITEEPCPLCTENLSLSPEHYGDHMGQHLEQIALASIPRNLMVEDDDDEDGGNDGNDRLSEPLTRPRRRARARSLTASILRLGEEIIPGVRLGGAQRPASVYAQENTLTTTRPRHPATFQCTLCPKRFTRAASLRIHLRSHTDERPFACSVCSKAFARNHDCKRHEALHAGEKRFVCRGVEENFTWGCGRRFARADALGRHFRSEAGRVCIEPLVKEEAQRRSRASKDVPIEQTAAFHVPESILQQYPALQNIDWSAQPYSHPQPNDAGLYFYADTAGEQNKYVEGELQEHLPETTD